jgi:hypothetical protein
MTRSSPDARLRAATSEKPQIGVPAAGLRSPENHYAIASINSRHSGAKRAMGFRHAAVGRYAVAPRRSAGRGSPASDPALSAGAKEAPAGSSPTALLRGEGAALRLRPEAILRPSCFIHPASPRIVAEAPGKSARTAPRIALRYPWASTGRIGSIETGKWSRGDWHAGRNRARTTATSAAQQRHAERSEWTIDLRFERAGRGRGYLAEEHVARILVEERTELLGIAAPPFADSLHRCALERQLAAIDENAPDRAIRVAVLVGIPDAH